MWFKKRKFIYIFHTTLAIAILCTQSFSFAQNDAQFNSSIKTVVIDAGHGGKDPGCLGTSNNEKDVCLSMALKLGTMIEKNFPYINVIYTRKTDVFVELNERAKIANRNNADLFICIHANAASAAAYGAETYALGLHRTDAQERVAERENSTIYLEEDGEEKYKDFELTPDAIIARQLQLSVFLDQSISFAGKLQYEFKKIGRHDRGVKQAGFLVLYKTTMPSVLIETGFLTNPKEEKFLAGETTQLKMANAMFVAFQKHKNELEGVDKEVIDNSENIENKEEQEDDTLTNSDNPFTSQKEEADADDVVFRVQIKTSTEKIPTSDRIFKGMKVYEYHQNEYYKYTVGHCINDLKAANRLKNKLREDGFQQAFVVGFLDGERISLQKAIKLAEK